MSKNSGLARRLMGNIRPVSYQYSERAAIFFDLENLVHAERLVGDWESALALVHRALRLVERNALPVVKVAVCDRGLARQMAVQLARLGIRTFPHRGGVDGADHALLDRIARDIPPSCDLVVIGSGDHIFANVVRSLRLAGKRVEVAARRAAISAELYKAANGYIDLTPANSEPAA